MYVYDQYCMYMIRTAFFLFTKIYRTLWLQKYRHVYCGHSQLIIHTFIIFFLRINFIIGCSLVRLEFNDGVREKSITLERKEKSTDLKSTTIRFMSTV